MKKQNKNKGQTFCEVKKTAENKMPNPFVEEEKFSLIMCPPDTPEGLPQSWTPT